MSITRIFGQHDEGTMAQLQDVATRAAYTAIMADGHRGYVMPIGGVAAYRDQVSVVGVGFDIACGNAAIRTDLTTTDLADMGHLIGLAETIQEKISFGVGRRNESDDAPVDDPLFNDPAWDVLPQAANKQNFQGKARSQLGTVGGGNHYVDVFADEQDRIWVGVHFGSRGFGHGVASGFLALGQGKPWNERVPEQETLFNLFDPLGEAYWAMMSLAGRYAYAGCEWVARKVVQLLGGTEQELVHNHHNFAWKERHFGEDLIVIRKGATPAFPGQKGFVGGSMGDDSVILEGTAVTDPDSPGETFVHAEQADAMFSTVHGAGRVMSRTAAKGKGWRKRSGPTSPGAVTRQMMSEWTKAKGVIVRGGDVDESPHVYRRLPDVLAEQGSTIKVLHTLRPLIVVMADPETRDPYKD